MTIKDSAKALYKKWMRFAHILGTINGHLILGLIFIFVIGAYAIFVRAINLLIRTGRFILGKLPSDKTSAWIIRERPVLSASDIRNPF